MLLSEAEPQDKQAPNPQQNTKRTLKPLHAPAK